ncbi:MAG TPA: hypothetical protein VK498_12205 [Ferruginibacter sp.]|nr:hypothetical protein [Ferruginibacter sp.]
MRYFIPLFAGVCFPLAAFCQDITGLWKGTMFNDSTRQSLQYEIVINKDKGKYSGFSHTWFLINEKKYYGIKKIKVHVANDGKVIIQDQALIENNYPILPNKNVLQLNVLDLAIRGDETILDGPFVTKRTKDYNELTGHINVKRINPSNESDLLQYLQKNIGNNFTAVK